MTCNRSAAEPYILTRGVVRVEKGLFDYEVEQKIDSKIDALAHFVGYILKLLLST